MTENRAPYLNATIPCPYCADGFVTAGDRHARTKQDVCQHCAGTGFAPAGTGETPQTSAPPLPPAGDRATRLSPEMEQVLDGVVASHPVINAALHDAEKRALAFQGLPEQARRLALEKWGRTWCENEAGSLAEFARLCRGADA